MKSLLFGTAGIPLSTEKRDTVNGIKRVRGLGLDAMELEFVQSVNISEQKAPEVKKTAMAEDIVLTCHGQYYINLTSKEELKIQQSKERILKAARIVNACGGWSATWHMAFYQGQNKEKVHEQVKKQLKEIVALLKDEGNTIWIRPETTGKPTQWGDLREVLDVSQEIDQVLPCIDFAHLHARYNGKNNTYEEFCAILREIENALGREGLDNMHIQVAGIAYSEKGERNHLPLQESDLNYQDLIRAWKDFKIKGVVIAESPAMEKDALLLQGLWKKM